MNNYYKEIKNFTFQDIISIVFIVASVLNIIACDKEKEYVISNNKKDKITANNIYILVLLIFICLYTYFIKVNYNSYSNCKDYESEAFLIRLYGSIFFLVGGVCFLYFRINDRENIQNIIEI